MWRSTFRLARRTRLAILPACGPQHVARPAFAAQLRTRKYATSDAEPTKLEFTKREEGEEVDEAEAQATNELFRLLVTAVMEGHTGPISAALDQFEGFDWNMTLGEDQETFLIIAVVSGNVPMVKMLLESGKVDGNQENGEGYTPLCLAVHRGLDMVRTMVESGKVDVNGQEAYGMSPLGLACSRGYNDVVDYLMSRPDTNLDYETRFLIGTTPLMMAAKAGQMRSVKLLVESGKVNVNRPEDEEWTDRAVMQAAHANHREVVEYLLKAGARYTDKMLERLEPGMQEAVSGKRIFSESEVAADENEADRERRQAAEKAEDAAAVAEMLMRMRELILKHRQSAE